MDSKRYIQGLKIKEKELDELIKKIEIQLDKFKNFKIDHTRCYSLSVTTRKQCKKPFSKHSHYCINHSLTVTSDVRNEYDIEKVCRTLYCRSYKDTLEMVERLKEQLEELREYIMEEFLKDCSNVFI